MFRVTVYFSTGAVSNAHDCRTLEQAYDMCKRYGMDAHVCNLRTDRLYIWRNDAPNTFEAFKAKLGEWATMHELQHKPITPLHQHDCTKCRFLGSLGTADLYYCQSDSGASYIVRYSSEGSDYYSSPDFRDELYKSVKASIGFSESWQVEEIERFIRQTVLLTHCSTAIINLIKRS